MIRRTHIAKREGFTIIELLVAMSLFITFLSIAIGSFGNILRMQRVLSKKIMLTSSLGIVTEQIEREIRTGFDFSVSGVPMMDVRQNTSDSLTFQSLAQYPPETVTFAKSVSANPNIGDAITRNGVSITPSTMKIKTLSFIVSEVRGATSLACSPWKITIFITAVPLGSDTPQDTVYAQTTVVSRVLPEDMRNDPYSCKI